MLGQQSPPKVIDSCAAYVRWMNGNDMSEVMDIERRCFDHPWSETDFRFVLRRPDRNFIGMVATLDEAVLGYMVYELCKFHIELVNLAVDPLFQQNGIGGQLIEKLKSKLSMDKRRAISLAVRDDNLPAHLFFRSCGFVATKILKDY